MICISAGPREIVEAVRLDLRARGVEAYVPSEAAWRAAGHLSLLHPGQRLILIAARFPTREAAEDARR
jgi:hypothetical protein